MSVQPRFSVVIPTYNQADFLKAALKSVLDQTFKDFEVIVVNNYSTDHTLEVVEEIDDDRVKVINFRNNGVIGSGRNVGIKAAAAPYISFLDSDDIWYSDKLKTVAQEIDADPQSGLFCHDQDIFRDGKMAKDSRYGPPESYGGDLNDYLMLVGNCVSTSATTVVKRVLEEVGYFSEDQQLMTVEDYDLWVRMSHICGFNFIHQILGKQNFHEASSSANVELHLSGALAILEKHSLELHKLNRPFPNGAIRMRRAKTFFGAARQYHRRGALKKALGYYSRTIGTNPFYRSTYAGLGLLFADLLMGQSRRKKITDSILPGI